MTHGPLIPQVARDRNGILLRMRHNSPERRDFLRLLLATLCFGAAMGIFQSTVNNFLESVHGFSAEERGWLEFPRELPGFLLIIVAGLLLIRL
ncbi:MAG: hypothetical protein V2A76_10760, partial [Planctomycetota bacterium]